MRQASNPASASQRCMLPFGLWLALPGCKQLVVSRQEPSSARTKGRHKPLKKCQIRLLFAYLLHYRGERQRRKVSDSMNAATRKYDEWKAPALRNVDPRHTAFLVIDLQTDFCSPNGALAALGSDVSPSAAVADRFKSFLPQVREELGLVAFFKLVYEPTKMSPSQRERLLRDGKPLLCDPRTGGCDLVISPGPSDLVFSKHRYSAFTNQQFCELLVERSIQTVVVTGVDTHICVEGTVRHGYDLGYRMLVVSDLVGTRASESARHEHALTLCDRLFSILIDSRTLLRVVREASNTSTMAIDTMR